MGEAYRQSAFTIMPTIRPKVAPMAMEGTKMPAGTFEPYETTTMPIRKTVAINNALAMVHCTEVLCSRQSSVLHDKKTTNWQRWS